MIVDKRAALLAEADRLETMARKATAGEWIEQRGAVVERAVSTRPGYAGLGIHEAIAHTSMTRGKFEREVDNARHIAEHDPERTLRRIAGVRAVVEAHAPDPAEPQEAYGEEVPTGAHGCVGCRSTSTILASEVLWPCPTISALYDAYCGGPE